MRTTRTTALVAVALSLASAAYAQEALKGEIVTVDKASGIIGIKLMGTVGSSDATAPTPFKVQDASMFKAVKPGDKVSFTSERVGRVLIIRNFTKE
ncbi:MAG: copper-binding protein [Pseudolabrys sp.]